MKTIFAIVSAVVLISCQQKENQTQPLPENETNLDAAGLFEKGTSAGHEKFIGTVHQAILGKMGTQTSNVSFEPKSRTHWHLHPGGQTLLVTDGVGYHQEEGKPVQIIKKGDVITIGKDVKHWHGGSKDQPMTHIAISIDHEAHPSIWFEPVSDEEYAKTD